MYELIKKIMEKAEKEKVDIGVAYDMLVVNKPDEELKKAYVFYQKYYFPISDLKNANADDKLKALCCLKEECEIDSYIEHLRKDGIIK